MYTYIYKTAEGWKETNDKTIANSDAIENIIVRFTDKEGLVFLSLIDQLIYPVLCKDTERWTMFTNRKEYKQWQIENGVNMP